MKLSIRVNGFNKFKASIPLHDLPRNLVERACAIIEHARCELQAAVDAEYEGGRLGRPAVYAHYDTFEAALFWYIVFFRPVIFETSDPVLGQQDWTLYSLIKSGRAKAINMSDCGVAIDETLGWAVLNWQDARREGGLLHGLDDTLAWRQLVYRTLGRSYELLASDKREELLKILACGSSFCTPGCALDTGFDFLRKRVWWFERSKQDDILVFDLKGLESVRVGIQDTELAYGLPEKMSRFKHFFVESYDEYRCMKRELRRQRARVISDEHLLERRLRARQWKAKQREKRKTLRWLGECVGRIWRTMMRGLKDESIQGGLRIWWTPREMDRALQRIAHRLIAGIVPPWDGRTAERIKRNADRIEDLLSSVSDEDGISSELIRAFSIWGRFSNVSDKREELQKFGNEILTWLAP